MTDAVRSIREMLEIALVTHDNASALGKTLQQLSESPFNKARITIIDNGSNDNTQEVCSRYLLILPQLEVIRYQKYIGTEAACLHAVEGLSAQYGWILRDEVRCDFTSGQEVVEAIQSNEYDALFVGSCIELGWSGDKTCITHELTAADTNYYSIFTSWSSLIFRTALFNEECLVKGYRHVNNIFSNFPFVHMLVEMDAKIFIAPRHMVTAGEDNFQSIGAIYRFAAWVNCCQSIKSVSLREKVICDKIIENGLLVTVSAWIARDNEFGSKRFWNSFIDIVCGMPPQQRRKLFILYAILLMPLPRIWRRSLLGLIAVRAAAVLRKLPNERQLRRDPVRSECEK